MSDDVLLNQQTTPVVSHRVSTIRSRLFARSFWRSTRRWAVGLVTIVPALIVAVWILLSLAILTAHRHSLDLETIVVPNSLSKEGFTSQVATRRLRDAIIDVQAAAKTAMAKTALDMDWELAAISIPRTGLSLQGIATAIRSIIPGWQHEVSGEFTQSDDGLTLRLRLNGRVVYSGRTTSSDPEAANSLFGDGYHGAAFRLVEKTQPYIAAAALYAHGGTLDDIAAAERDLNDIIAHSTASDENALWAYNLKGLIAQHRGDYPTAIRYFQLSGIAVAHGNLGNLFADDDYTGRDLDKAIVEYQKAIALNPRLANIYTCLGEVYRMQKKMALAEIEYQQAVGTDNAFAPAHDGLGIIYEQDGKLDDAEIEYSKAISLDSNFAAPHNNLGTVHERRQQLDQAVAEYEKAIQLEPDWPLPYGNLDAVLRKISGSSVIGMLAR